MPGLNYEQYEKEVLRYIEAMIPEPVTFAPVPVQKNNGITKNGIEVRFGRQTCVLVIYPEDYYMDYLNGSSVSDIFEQVAHSICGFPEPPETDIMDIFLHYENAREKIMLRLVNYERNKSRLEEAPYIPFLDLAIVFYLSLEDWAGSSAYALITDSLASSWNITCEQLYKQALKNSSRIRPWKIRPLHEVIGVDPGIFPVFLYILTNPVMQYGAACILYEDVLENFSREIQGSYYVIPSSVHEVLLCPVSVGISPEYLTETVNEVNRNAVGEEDFLSDSLYLYKKEEDRLIMVSGDSGPGTPAVQHP